MSNQTLGKYGQVFFQASTLGLKGFSLQSLRLAGLKRCLSFILQPVENWSRYPELVFVLDRLANTTHQDKVLDLGSPKMAGVLLAQKTQSHFTLTDIWADALKEVEGLINKNNLHSQVSLQKADCRSLQAYKEQSFHYVYSISVLEHIESLEEITTSLKEISRVLKPGGKAFITVPLEKIYRKQYIQEEVYGRNDTKNFFSHYFDTKTAQKVFGQQHTLTISEAFVSKWNTQSKWLKVWMRCPQKIRGLLGIVNLMIAPFSTSVQKVDWQNWHAPKNGDLFLCLEKA